MRAKFYICDRLPENQAQRSTRQRQEKSTEFFKMY